MILNKSKPLANTLIPMIIIMVFIASYSYVYDSKLDLNGDNAYYYMLGKSIASGEGYTNIYSINKSTHYHFPPGYPVIISIILTVFPDSIMTVKLFNGVFFLCSVILFFFLIKKLTKNLATATIVSLAVILNAHFLRWSTIMMSEISLLLVSLLTIICFIKSDKREDFWKDPYFYLTLFLAGTAYYIKTLGITLFSGIIFYLFLKTKWKQIPVYIGSFVLFFIPLFLRTRNVGGNSHMKSFMMVDPYRPELGKAGFSDYADRFFTNVDRYLSKEIPNANFPFFPVDHAPGVEAGISMWLVGLIITIIALYGLLQIKQYRWLLLAYLFSFFSILLLWHGVWYGARFILPIVPFIILGVVHGINSLLEKFVPKKRNMQWITIVLVLGLLPTLIPLHKQSVEKFPRNWENYLGLAKWAKDNVEPTAVISCRKPMMFYLYSGTYTTGYKHTKDQDQLLNDLEAKQVDYVILDQLDFTSTPEYLYPAVKNNPERFSVVQHLENPDTYLLKFNK